VIVHSIVLIMINVSLFCQILMRSASASASASPFFATRFWNGKCCVFFSPLRSPQGLCICHTQPDHELGALKATTRQAQTECIHKPFQASGHVTHIRMEGKKLHSCVLLEESWRLVTLPLERHHFVVTPNCQTTTVEHTPEFST
jgi:hypothetical protein